MEANVYSLLPGGTRPTEREAKRIGITVSCVITLCLVSPLLAVFRLDLPLTAFGSPLRLGISGEVLVVVMAALIGWAGAQSLFELHPEYSHSVRLYSHFALPSAMAVAATISWQTQQGTLVEGRLVVAALIAITLSLVLLAQYLVLGQEGPTAMRLRTILSFVSLGVAMYLWLALFETRARALLVVPGAFIVALTVALDLLQYESVSERRILQVVLAIGLIIAECAWALMLGRLEPLRAAFVLLMVGYMMVGLARRYFEHTLDRGAVLEHGTVAVLLYVLMELLV